MSQPVSEIQAIAADIAAQLSETEPEAISQIERVVEIVGEAKARSFLRKTLEIEVGQGVMTLNGKRRRTPGGVYFFVARGRIRNKEELVYIWPRLAEQLNKVPQPKQPPFEWEQRLDLVPDLLNEKGEATTVKITLIGRPGKIVEKGEVVLTTMQNTNPPTLPKSLPVPPSEPTTYVVYIAHKQWMKVASAIKNPQDSLIIDGYPVFDKRLGAMSVFAQSVTTKLLQRQKRENEGS